MQADRRGWANEGGRQGRALRNEGARSSRPDNLKTAGGEGPGPQHGGSRQLRPTGDPDGGRASQRRPGPAPRASAAPLRLLQEPLQCWAARLNRNPSWHKLDKSWRPPRGQGQRLCLAPGGLGLRKPRARAAQPVCKGQSAPQGSAPLGHSPHESPPPSGGACSLPGSRPGRQLETKACAFARARGRAGCPPASDASPVRRGSAKSQAGEHELQPGAHPGYSGE